MQYVSALRTLVVQSSMLFFRLQSTCRALGAHLAEILTREDNAYVEAIMFEHPGVDDIWLGATDLMTEGKWFWATSDVALDDGFTSWQAGQPDNHYHRGAIKENCLSLRFDFRHWHDDICDNKHSFICQKPLNSVIIGK